MNAMSQVAEARAAFIAESNRYPTRIAIPDAMYRDIVLNYCHFPMVGESDDYKLMGMIVERSRTLDFPIALP